MFVIDNKTNDDLGLILLNTSEIDLIPEIDARVVNIPGRPGVYDFGAELSYRVFRLSLALNEIQDLEDLENQISYIAEQLTDQDGRPRTVLFYFTTDSTKRYQVRIYNKAEIERDAFNGRFTLTLVAVNPFAEGTTQTVAVPATVSVDGNIRTAPTFTVTFNNNASTMQITLGGDYVKVDHDFVNGDELVINCETQSVMLNGYRYLYKLDWQNSTFFKLNPGSNTITASSTGVASISMAYKPRWI